MGSRVVVCRFDRFDRFDRLSDLSDHEGSLSLSKGEQKSDSQS